MKDGFIKVACATPKIKVADTQYNTNSIKTLISSAEKAGVKVIVFPELCICGYTVGDLLLNKSLLNGVINSIIQLVEYSKSVKMLILVGAPLVNYGKLYNTAVAIYDGDILGVVPKKNIPNYSEFYEKRYFSEPIESLNDIIIDNRSYPFGTNLIFKADNIDNLAIACEICEDLWVSNPPSNSHAEAGAYIIANLSASNEVIGKENYRRNLVLTQSCKAVCGYLYADAGEGESSTDMVFSGHNIIAENGAILKESALFTTGLTISEIDIEKLKLERIKISSYAEYKKDNYRYIGFKIKATATELTREISPLPFVPLSENEREHRGDLILNLQAQGLKTRIEHTQAKCIVVGISGGLDSTLALIVCDKAMQLLNRPSKDIIAVTMPCFGTTSRTLNNARQLINAIGATYIKINIEKSVKQHFIDINQEIDNYDVTYENAQARERTQVLMDLANKMGGLVIGTGDLSELALGFATYNGDHMSSYAVNSSVPKTLIRHIVKYKADTADNLLLKKVLYSILDTPVSPELLPASIDGEILQKTESIVGPYELHDFFLYYNIRYGFTPTKIYRMACYSIKNYSSEDILKYLKMFYKRFFREQFKRSCMPDGPKIGSVTLSPRADWRMPSDASAELWLQEIDNIK